MARIFTASTPDYIRSDSSPVTTIPCTISCWIRVASAPGSDQVLLYYGDVSNSSSYTAFLMLSSGAIQCWPRWNVSPINSSTGKADDKWHHLMWRVWLDADPSPTHRHEFWLDGVSVGTSSGSDAGSLSLMDRVTAGRLDRASPAQPLDGTVAEVALASMRGEINHAAALARGVSPHKVFGTNLKFYAPLWGLNSPEPEFSGAGNDMTLFGSPAKANHASVVPYTPRWSASVPLIESGGAATRRIYLDDVLISIPA